MQLSKSPSVSASRKSWLWRMWHEYDIPMLALMVGWLLLWGISVCGTIYVAAHFIIKYW